jgi:hypothetical protein
MRRLLIACALLLRGGILSAQDLIRYYPPAGITITGSVPSGFRTYFPNQTDMEGSMVIGTGGANMTYAAGADCQSDPLAGSDPWNGKYNTFFGLRAGDANTCGAGNTFFGHLAGARNTIGSQNLFMGWGAGQYNVAGYHNTFLGIGAGQNEASVNSNYNVYVGTDAGLISTGGEYNVFVGASSGSGNLTGNANMFIGYGTGHGNGSGARNLAIGYSALYNAINTNYNIALGAQAGYYETSGYHLYMDSIDRGSLAAGRERAPIYGFISPASYPPFQQLVQFNGSVVANGSLAFTLIADTTGIQFGQTVMPDAGTDGRFDVTTGSATTSIGVMGFIDGLASPYPIPSVQGTKYQVIYGGRAYVAPAEDTPITRGHHLLQSATAGYVTDSATVSTPGLNIAKALYSEPVTNVIVYNGCTGGAGCINTALNTPNVGPAGQITLSADVVAQGWAVGDPVIFWNSGGATPTGLTDGAVYWIVSVSTTNVTLQVSLNTTGVVVPSSQGNDATQYLQRLPLSVVSIQ